MSTYYPEGVDMRQADPTFQPYEAYLPTVPDPLDVESPKIVYLFVKTIIANENEVRIIHNEFVNIIILQHFHAL